MTELLLTEHMAQNYIALQNFLNGIEISRKPQNGGNYTKSAKRKARKVEKIHAQGGKCLDCSMKFPFNGEKYDKATVDHVIPYRYGSNLDHNSEFVCDPCNQKREKNRLQVILNYFGTIS